MQLLIVLACILCIMAIAWLAMGSVILFCDDIHDIIENRIYAREQKKRGKKK